MAETLKGFVPEVLEASELTASKLQRLAELVQRAEHLVVFTGAGVSTSAGLPDYRGPQGLWTRRLQGEAITDELPLKEAWEPTRAHRAIRRLQQRGVVHFVATTNVDGLHRKSGIPEEVLAELHGNSGSVRGEPCGFKHGRRLHRLCSVPSGYVEECEICLKRFYRSFVTRTAKGLFEHRTGRLLDL